MFGRLDQCIIETVSDFYTHPMPAEAEAAKRLNRDGALLRGYADRIKPSVAE